MNAGKDGGPAFPMLVRCFDNDMAEYFYSMEGGLSARDYFAAKAMHALVADPALTSLLGMEPTLAKFSYAMADAMLIERGK
jgi:hypothetical protein